MEMREPPAHDRPAMNRDHRGGRAVRGTAGRFSVTGELHPVTRSGAVVPAADSLDDDADDLLLLPHPAIPSARITRPKATRVQRIKAPFDLVSQAYALKPGAARSRVRRTPRRSRQPRAAPRSEPEPRDRRSCSPARPSARARSPCPRGGPGGVDESDARGAGAPLCALGRRRQLAPLSTLRSVADAVIGDARRSGPAQRSRQSPRAKASSHARPVSCMNLSPSRISSGAPPRPPVTSSP